jgi:DNA-binding response OmpR family regulator
VSKEVVDMAESVTGQPCSTETYDRGSAVGCISHPTNRSRPGVLVVDDEEYLRHILDVALRQEGFTVWLADDGWEALDLYRKHFAAIDMVLLDVRMPGLDGPGTLTALRKLDPEVRCCFMSGDLGQYTERSLRDSGAGPVLHKPFRLEELARLVRQMLGHAGQTVPSR